LADVKGELCELTLQGLLPIERVPIDTLIKVLRKLGAKRFGGKIFGRI